MTRQKAIETIKSAWLERDGHWLISRPEVNESYAELLECLRTLGCSDEEIGPAGESDAPDEG